MTPRLAPEKRPLVMRRFVRLPVAALICLIIGSIFLAESALHAPNGEKPDPVYGDTFARGAGASNQPAQVRGADGAVLDAWLFTPRRPNGAGVILLHGVGDTRVG